MSRDGKFGTFGGVYTPSVLTILGVIMYLRLPWVVGQAGLYQAIGVIVVAHVISVCTGLSISSIATDKAVGAGGPYYIVSRSLGLPIGGTLGLALFVGLAFSISLYIIGFSESLLGYLGIERSIDAIRVCGTITIVGLTIVTFISTALAIKTQYLIFALICLSLLSILAGSTPALDAPQLAPPPDGASLPLVFGIFFPAVTGFTAGVNMSGDLRSAKRSIPLGTMLSITTGLVVYIGLAVFLAWRVPAEQLVNDPEILLNIAWSKPLVLAGIWGATLSSALGSILGSPRILQAISADGITPRFFAKGYGPTNEPRNALLLAFLIGEAGILIGELDAIARIVSMVFLATYGFLNVSCAIESWVSPDFRPDFRIPKSISVLGAVTCLVVMIQLDLLAMAGSVVLMASIFVYLKRQQLRLESGDTWEGVWSSLVRAGLHRLRSANQEQRNWKPNILSFTEHPRTSEPGRSLRRFAASLIGATGILTQVRLARELSSKAKSELDASDDAIPEVEESASTGIFERELGCTDDRVQTILSFCRYHGFAGIAPNTVLFPWDEYRDEPERLVTLLDSLAALDYNQLIFARGGRAPNTHKRRVDIWWRDQGGNLPLSLSLVRFVTSTAMWDKARIRFVLLSDNPYNNDVLRTTTRRYLANMRVDADIKVISNTLQARSYEDWVRHESIDADLVVIPLPDQPSASDVHFLNRIGRLVQDAQDVLMIRASSSFPEILSPGRNASDSLLPSPPGSEDAFVLPELQLPAAAALHEHVTDLAERYRNVLAAFDEYCIARVHSQTIQLVRRLKTVADKQVDLIDKGLSDSNARKRRQLLNRVQSSFVMETREILGSYVKTDLDEQRANLAGRVEAFLYDDTLVQPDPKARLRVERPPEDFAPHPEDPSHIRRFKRRRRLVAWLRRKRDPWYKISVVKLQRYYFEQAVQHVLRRSADQLVVECHQLAVQLGKTLSASSTNLTAVGDIAAGETASDDRLQQLRCEIGQPFDELTDRIKELVQRHRRRIITETHRLLQSYATDVDRMDLQRFVRRHRGVDKRQVRETREALLGVAEPFAETLALLHRRARLGLTITGFQHRLTAIHRREHDAILLQLRNGALHACEELRGSLGQLRETLQQHRSDPLTVPRAAPEAADRVDPKEAARALSSAVEASLADLPDTVQTVTDETLDRLNEGHMSSAAVIDVDVRALAGFLVETELVAGMYQTLESVPDAENRALTVAQDVLRLLTFQLRELEAVEITDPAERKEHLLPGVESGIERLEREVHNLRQLGEEVGQQLQAQLAHVIDSTNAYELTRIADSLKQHMRLRQGRRAMSDAQGLLRRLSSRWRQTMVSLLYRSSAGVVLAKSLEARASSDPSVVERVRAALERLNPRKAVVEALPFYYRQLFTGQAMGDTFWVGREAELAKARRVIQAHREGDSGSLMVTGDRAAGKTALCQYVTGKLLAQRQVCWVRPPAGGSVAPYAFRVALQRATKAPGSSYEEIFASLPDHSVIVLDDLELWWERSLEGFAVIDEVIALVRRFGGRFLFIIAANRQAFHFISRFRPIADTALGIIECGPLPAKDLASVITQRHGSTGIVFQLGARREDQLTQWQLARLFSSHFRYCHGTVGAALRSWVTHIERVRDETLVLRKPERAPTSALEGMRTPWRALLLELALHKQLTTARIERITGETRERVRDDIDALDRMRLITRARHDVVELNPFVEHVVTRQLQQEGLLA